MALHPLIVALLFNALTRPQLLFRLLVLVLLLDQKMKHMPPSWHQDLTFLWCLNLKMQATQNVRPNPPTKHQKLR